MIVKEIVERDASANPPAPPQPPKAPSHKNGFPAPKRRAPIARATPASSSSTPAPSRHARTTDDGTASFGEKLPHIDFQHPFAGRISESEEIRRQTEAENVARVQAMSTAEREQEKEELLERFGPGLIDIMRKRKEAREGKRPAVIDSAGGPSRLQARGEVDRVREEIKGENEQRVMQMSEQERMEEIKDLEERFGSTTLRALRARAEARQRAGEQPSTSNDRVAQKQPRPFSDRSTVPIDETPEDIKERYFPNHASEPEKLAWMRPTATTTSDNTVRFDLQGKVLSKADQASIPTSAGLHHHGSSPDLAGYTIDDILWLARSTVASQRITMLNVLGHVLDSYAMGGLSVEARTAVEESQAVKKGADLGVDILLASTRSIGILRAGIDVLYHALGGSTWQWMDAEVFPTYRPGNTESPLAQLPWMDLLEPIKHVLDRRGDVPASSTTALRLLRILRRGVHHSAETGEAVAPVVPSVINECVKSRPWPLDTSDLPNIESLRLARDVIDTSRSSAQALAESDMVNTLLRFLVVTSWPSADSNVAAEWAAESLRIMSRLGRYGLGVGTATTIIDVLRSFGSWVNSQCVASAGSSPAIAAYFELLAVWTTCAIDPHQTTPEHALTWAQVSAMAWLDEAIDATEALSRHGGRWAETSSAVALLVACTAGVKVNGGEAERRELVERLRAIGLADKLRLATDGAGDDYADFFSNVARLDNLLDSVALPNARGDRLFARPADWPSQSVHVRLAMINNASAVDDAAGSFKEMSEILSQLEPGYESEALDLVDRMLQREYPDLRDDLVSIAHPDKLQILRPLLHFAILPSASDIISPAVPNHLYLKATTGIFRPAPPSGQAKRSPGLPLPVDWIFTPLDELLDSATSPAFSQASPDWDPSEIDLVRATLLLARLQQTISPLSKSAVLFNLMKVFMLEHNSQSAGDHPEAFRDHAVAHSLSTLMRPILSTGTSGSGATIETDAAPFLGPDLPFYQFYSDFLGLYEAISFSDPVFSQLVLAPLSMRYPVDYRKLLWVDHPTALRSIRTTILEAPLEHGAFDAYLLPIETDADVLAGYTRALVNGWVSRRTEVLWRIATWHLASLFWKETDRAEVRKGLMGAILRNGSDEVIKEICAMCLNVAGDRKIDEEETTRRAEVVRSIFGDKAVEKTKRVLA